MRRTQFRPRAVSGKTARSPRADRHAKRARAGAGSRKPWSRVLVAGAVIVVAAVAWVLANQAGRPQLKATLPEQLVKDMKTAKEQGWGKITPVLAPLAGGPK